MPEYFQWENDTKCYYKKCKILTLPTSMYSTDVLNQEFCCLWNKRVEANYISRLTSYTYNEVNERVSVGSNVQYFLAIKKNLTLISNMNQATSMKGAANPLTCSLLIPLPRGEQLHFTSTMPSYNNNYKLNLSLLVYLHNYSTKSSNSVYR